MPPPVALRAAFSERRPSPFLEVLCVVEGVNDIEFLLRLSRILAAAGPQFPNLAELQLAGKLLFLPRGGGDLLAWADRLAPLGANQFHLCDREIEPECRLRLHEAQLINQRPGCRAAVSQKRALENYLHPAAIYEARCIEIDFGDRDDVADLAVARLFSRRNPNASWAELPGRARKRLRDRAKKWLNTNAVDCMTCQRLADRGGLEEVASWLMAIGGLLS